MDRSAYCAQVLSHLRRLSRREREAVRAELEEHMEDRVRALLDLGYDEKLAEERTVAAMGDPAEVGREMERQYPRGWMLLGRGAMVLTLLLALFLARPLLERVPAAWESLVVRCAPKAVLDISERREDFFDPLGLDAWDLDAEAVIRDVHFRVYQVGYEPDRAGGNTLLAAACWRTNPFQEALDDYDGYSLRVRVDGEETGYSMEAMAGGICLYSVWADPGQSLTMTWEIYGETAAVSITLPEVGS